MGLPKVPKSVNGETAFLTAQFEHLGRVQLRQARPHVLVRLGKRCQVDLLAAKTLETRNNNTAAAQMLAIIQTCVRSWLWEVLLTT